MNSITRRLGVVLSGGLAASLSVGACSNGSLATPTTALSTTVTTTAVTTTAVTTTAVTTTAVTTTAVTPTATEVAPTATEAPTSSPPTTPPATSDGGSETTWMLLFVLAVVVAAVLATVLVASRRAPPPPPTPPEPPTPPAPPVRPRTPVVIEASRGFPPTIGDPQPSAVEEPKLQASAVAPADVLVHSGKVARKGGSDLVVRAASLRGTASRLEQKERQDAYSFLAGRKHLIVAVADGVGSLPHSGIAARVASRNSCRRTDELLEKLGELDDASIDRVFESGAWDVVLAERERVGDPSLSVRDAARSMATTLVLGTLDLEGAHDVRVTLARVGDSSAWLLRGDEAVALFGDDDEGAVVDNKTVALPGFGDEGVEIVRRVLQPDDVLILATDGFAGSWGSGVGEVADYFGLAWRRPPDHITYAGQVAYRRRSFDDDRTAIAMWV